MTHKRPKPDAATAPYPAKPSPHDKSAAPAAKEAEARGSRIDKRLVAGVAGVAVGSAALAAALLFAGRTWKPKSAAIPQPVPPTPGPGAPDASDIRIGNPTEFTD